MSNTGTSKFYLHAGASYSNISLENEYTFTAAGLAGFTTPQVADFTEKSSVNKLTYTAGAGYEFLAVDNVTMNLVMGYRFMKAAALTHLNSYNAIDRVVLKGDRLKNNDGLDREANLGGVYVGAGFRFYISVL